MCAHYFHMYLRQQTITCTLVHTALQKVLGEQKQKNIIQTQTQLLDDKLPDETQMHNN